MTKKLSAFLDFLETAHLGVMLTYNFFFKLKKYIFIIWPFMMTESQKTAVFGVFCCKMVATIMFQEVCFKVFLVLHNKVQGLRNTDFPIHL